ncbi:MAG: FAD-binding oxidoreductase [Gammaproteobacteria bacterium]
MSNVLNPDRTDRELLIDKLRTLLGDRLSTNDSVLQQHGRGESWHPVQAPDAVAFAQSTEEVSQIVRYCADSATPVIAYGTGTSLEGQVQAVKGGICIDLSQMNQIIEVNSEDLDCKVEAGVTRKQLNQHLRDTGLFFPIDPGANTSIGGMTATRASGTNAVRYGTMRENVFALTVVTANGDIIHTGTRARKSAAGYDLTRLFVGSEGTLGIITEVTLRLYGRAETISAAIVNFPDVRSAANTTIQTIQMGIPVARIELVDRAYIKAINEYSKTDYPLRDTLFLEFHGTKDWVAEQVKLFDEISQEFGASGFEWAENEEDRNRLWSARHDAYYAGLAMSPGSQGYVTDVCVPISRLADCITETQQDLASTNLYSPILGHVGDGNFHLTIFIDPDDDEMFQSALEVDARLVERALDMGGTCSGEHGIGLGKLKHMRREHGDNAIATMQAIKQALDPQNIMNPGKVIDC